MAIKYFVYGIQIFDSAIPSSSHFKDVLLFGSEKMAKNRAEIINSKAVARVATEVAVTTNMQEINVTKNQHDMIARKRNGVWQSELAASVKQEATTKRAESEKLRAVAAKTVPVAQTADLTKSKTTKPKVQTKAKTIRGSNK